MTVRVQVAPELLKWATERAGWDAATVARRAPRFDEWVEDTRQPTLKQLEKFANDTHAPFGMLFLPEPPHEDIPIPDMRTIGNVAVQRPSADLLDTIYFCQERQDWFREYARINGAAALDFIGSVTTRTPPVRVATAIRDRLDFDLTARAALGSWQEAFRSLLDRIQRLGVLVMVNGVVGADPHRKLNPEEFRGFALSDAIAPLIFVNAADTKAGQIFTLIHELGHLWLGESALSDAAMAAPGGHADELWCNAVAAEVLVPLAALREDYQGTCSAAELERLAARYRVSTLVVLKRIHDAGYLSWDRYEDEYAAERARVLDALEKKRGPNGGGNYYYTLPIRLGHEFVRSVISSTFEGKTLYREAYQLLGVRKHETFTRLATEMGVA